MNVLIAGGGVAGAAAACLLGSEATLFERECGPHHKVCGEFVSWEAADALDTLGLNLRELGATAVTTVRLLRGCRVAEARLPRPGWSLSRRILDEGLLSLARERGATVLRGQVIRHATARTIQLDSAVGTAEGDRVFLATGKHGLRSFRREAAGRPLIGFKTYLRPRASVVDTLEGTVEVHLFDGGYAGLQPSERGTANLCLLLDHAVFESTGGTWSAVLDHLSRHAPALRERLRGATELLPRPLSIFRVPYGFVHAGAAGPHRLGDQMGVIPSFSGDGMAVALHTAFLAAAEPDPARFHARVQADLRGQIGRAMLLQRAGLRVPDLLARVATAWPGALRLIARLTRVPPSRLAWR